MAKGSRVQRRQQNGMQNKQMERLYNLRVMQLGAEKPGK